MRIARSSLIAVVLVVVVATVAIAGHGPGGRVGPRTLLDPQDVRGQVRVTAAGAGRLGLAIRLRPGERLYGLGERFTRPELRGQVVDNWVQDRRIDPSRTTSYAPMPMLLSSRGWALLLRTTARARFDVGRSDPRRVLIDVDARAVDVAVVHGPTLRASLRRIMAVVGRPARVPRAAVGVWKALLGGHARVLADLDRLRAARAPLDAVWIYDLVDPASGFGWPWHVFGGVPAGAYGDPAAVVADLHRRGVKVMGYLNPFVRGAAFAAAARGGALVRDRTGAPMRRPWMYGGVYGIVDVGVPRAAAWFGARVRAGLARTGFDGAMLDFGEGLPAGASSAPAAHNAYPVAYDRAVAAAAAAAKPDAVFMARAGYLGSQRYVPVRWPGDQRRAWDARTGLPSALRAMLNGSVAGWPVWGPDIGGYTGAAPGLRDEDELWLRWLQLGALSPLMRDMLGAQSGRPVHAMLDAAMLRAWAGYARLHRRLEPYLLRVARAAHRTGLPVARPLWLVDPGAPERDDEYLLGDDVLVAPVLAPGVRSRAVWLPHGVWRDVWTGRVTRGGRTVRATAPLHRIPLWVRATARGTGL